MKTILLEIFVVLDDDDPEVEDELMDDLHDICNVHGEFHTIHNVEDEEE